MIELTRRWVAPTLLRGAIEIVNALLQGECKWLSSVMKAAITRKAVLQLLLSTPLWTAGLLLVSDGVGCYLWGALLLWAAWRMTRPMVREFSKVEEV